MPALHGTYFFADWKNDWIRSFRVQDGTVVDLQDRTAELNRGLDGAVIDGTTSFGEDARGELYVLSGAGTVYRIVPAPGPLFQRGDANVDLTVDVSDAIFTLLHLFSIDDVRAPCDDALDANDDGSVDLADSVFILAYLFAGGPAPAVPFGVCGADASEDSVPCASFPLCE
jgi:hypothetical protein